MPTDTLMAACVGKLPSHGDFVRHRATTPAVRAFDEWVQKGLYQARQQQRPALDGAYDAAPAYRFVFRSPDVREQLMGVMQPSRDQAGRMYPFTVAVEVEPEAFGVRQLPYALHHAEAFYAEAQALVATATRGDLSHHEVTDRVEAMQPALRVSTAAPPAYKRHLQQQTMKTFAEQLFGHFGDARKYRLFKNLLDILLPFQERASVQMGYGLKFPLGTAGDALAFHAAFWAELCLRLLDYPDVTPSLFWTARPHPEASDEPALFLFLNPPQPRAFFHLVIPDAASDYICDLMRMGDDNATEAVLGIPDTYGTMLETEELSLWEFLREL